MPLDYTAPTCFVEFFGRHSTDGQARADVAWRHLSHLAGCISAKVCGLGGGTYGYRPIRRVVSRDISALIAADTNFPLVEDTLRCRGTAPGEHRWSTREAPRLARDWLVKIRVCGICGTDSCFTRWAARVAAGTNTYAVYLLNLMINEITHRRFDGLPLQILRSHRKN